MIVRNKVVVLIQKILMFTCLLHLMIVLPVLGNPQLPGLKGVSKPVSSPYPGLAGLPQTIGQLVHSIKKGETLSEISLDYFVALQAIVSLNQIPQPNQVSINQKILIPPVDYAYALKGNLIGRYEIQSGDTVAGICRTFGLSNWQIYRLNPEIENRNPVPGRSLFVPAKPKPFLKYPIAEIPPTVGFIRPVSGLITSRYGPRWGRIHYGIDLAAPAGKPVQAAAAGQVRFAGWRGTYGQLIIIVHGKYSTYYGHLSKILVKPGDKVSQGAIIGLVGSTGRAYGSHLHFEVERSGIKLNPLLFLKN